MIALDTSVLVRLAVADGVEEGRAARKLLSTCSRQKPAFVALTTIVELVAVLSRGYMFEMPQIARFLTFLLESANVRVEGEDVVEAALALASRRKVSFSDAVSVVTARSRGARPVTLNPDLARQLPGMELIA